MDEDVGETAVVSACRGFCSVPGPLQSVQRAELWGDILALQATDGVHLGVDNLNVVRHVGRFLDGRTTSRPAELVKDGDLLLLIERMLCLRGLDTVRISTVKGHADDDLVQAGEFFIWVGCVIMGPMRLLTLAVGGCLGGLLMLGVIILGCVLFGARLSWACIGFLLPLPGLLSTMMESLVLLWILRYGLEERRVVHAVRDRAFLPGLAGISDGEWCVVPATPSTCHDIESWPYSVGMLVKWVAFLYSLHWPQGWTDLGVGGVSNVELLILCELWAGERLQLEKAVPRYRRAGRPISVSAVPFGPGTDIWRSCRYIGACFVCDIGANHCRLRHLGWEKCRHDLTSRPRESASEGFLNELPVLCGYPSGSASVLLGGELSLRYCSNRFSCRVPNWGLHSHGHVRGLITESAGFSGHVEGWSCWSCLVAWIFSC